jgi:hypothetical protein
MRSLRGSSRYVTKRRRKKKEEEERRKKKKKEEEEEENRKKCPELINPRRLIRLITGIRNITWEVIVMTAAYGQPPYRRWILCVRRSDQN